MAKVKADGLKAFKGKLKGMIKVENQKEKKRKEEKTKRTRRKGRVAKTTRQEGARPRSEGEEMKGGKIPEVH